MKAEILILGVLHRGDMHPYEIKRRLKTANVESYLDVDVGTLYYAVRQLAKDGLIEERGQEMSGRQVRTVYGLTPSGRDRFQTLLHDTLASNAKPMNPIYPALVFLHLTDAKQAAALMAGRIRDLKKGLAITEGVYDYFRETASGGMRLLMENAIAHQRTELDWTHKALKELQDGAITGGRPEDFDPKDFAAAFGDLLSRVESSEE